MEYLQKAKEKECRDYLDIGIFGADPNKEFVSEYFFNDRTSGEEVTNYGELSPQQMSKLFAAIDAFVNYSTF